MHDVELSLRNYTLSAVVRVTFGAAVSVAFGVVVRVAFPPLEMIDLNRKDSNKGGWVITKARITKTRTYKPSGTKI